MKPTRHITRIDEFEIDGETGEQTPVRTKWVAIREKTKHPEDYYMAHHEGHRHLAKMRLTGTMYAVMHSVLARLDYSSRFTLLSPTDIADEIGIRTEQVSKALAQLCQRGILTPGPKHGRTTGYKLNDTYGWKGHSDALIALRRAKLKLVTSSGK